MLIIAYSHDSLLFEGVRAVDNVALSRPTRQSSVLFGGTSDRANDGNIDGYYSDNSCTFTAALDYPWWAVDLGSERLVRSVIIYNRVDGEYNSDNRDPFIYVLNLRSLCPELSTLGGPNVSFDLYASQRIDHVTDMFVIVKAVQT